MSYTLDFPIQYIANPDRFATIGLGKLYIGVVDGDPAAEPADRIQVYIARQNDTDLAIPQPINLTAGGVPVYLGSPVTLKINQSFSCAVLDKNDQQVYYSPKAGEIIDELNSIAAEINSLRDDILIQIDNVSLLVTTEPVVGKIYFLKEYGAGTGVGGGELVAKSGAITPDNGITFASGTAGVYFERVWFDFVTPEMFGATAGTDATAEISDAIDYISGIGGGVVRCESENYLIDGNVDPSVFVYGGVKMKPNVHLDMNGATFNLIPNANANYCIINCYQITDFSVSNGYLVGDIATHLGATGEFGHGLFLAESKRFIIYNVQSDDCWGDGFYISEENANDNLKAEDGFLYNIRANRNRRQGMSITGAKNIHVVDFKFTNTATINGTAPGAGLDIEPLASGVPCEDISFTNGYISGNSLGVVLDAVHAGNIKNVSFNNVTIKSSAQSGVFSNRSPDNIIGVRFNNSLIENGIYGGVGCSFVNTITVRGAGSTSIYAIEATSNTKNLKYIGGEIRSIGGGFKLFFIPGSKTLIERPVFDNTRFVLESGANGPNTVLVTFSPVDFLSCRFETAGAVPTGNFGFDFSDGRMGRNFAWLENCTIESTWHSGVSYLIGPYTMNQPKQQAITQPATLTPNCAIADIIVVTMTSATSMGVGVPTNAYGKTLTICIKNASGGALGSIVWNAIYKLAAWTNPANGFSRSITFNFDGTNWVEISRTTVDVTN